MITPPKIIIAAPNQIFESTTSLKIKYPANEAQRRPVYSKLARNDASAFFRAILKNRNAKPPTNPVRKNKNQSDYEFVRNICSISAEVLHWLADQHQQEFILIDHFLYPGHTTHRMHAHPKRTGLALIDSLLKAKNKLFFSYFSNID